MVGALTLLVFGVAAWSAWVSGYPWVGGALAVLTGMRASAWVRELAALRG